MLNSDIRDRLAAAQAFRWEVAQTLSDMAERLRNSDGREQEDEGPTLFAEWLRRGAEGGRDIE
ncbi:hypothetical protein M2323_001139 [Rhodoblastus acidophilus]|uniref:hypothetical protein n=1 Tax=Rhodoblastus acidophilus TaxID=1074 RepID=UPI002224C2F3|nr:hypothetical protein [Rhodoblastus acidophilus]MCW2283447.1 hypothetical protein [Rhodoblastus acidophilus]MCW2332229.1 hypothetical protein [Rhodoblastus acidophilus]